MNKDIKNIMDGINSETIKTEVAVVTSSDPTKDLKQSICDFYKERMNSIIQNDNLKSTIELKLLEKISADELTTPQLIQVMKFLRNEDIAATDSLLNILKPTPNASSFLEANSVSSEDADPFNQFTEEQLKSVENLRKFMEINRNRENKKD